MPRGRAGRREAMDDSGNGRVGFRIPLVVGELELLGNSTSLVCSFRGSQIHDCQPG